MRKFLTAIVLISFVTLGVGMCVSYAGEVDILLQKLVEKGVLTAGEAQEIKTETQEQVKLEIAQGKNASLPQWLQTTKFKGDFRLRGQRQYKKSNNNNSAGDTSIERSRARYRLRFGAESKVFDRAKVYFGLASGDSGDPRSTNQTLQDQFSKKNIYIDYAYADYIAAPWATLIGGRMKNPLWEPGDMLWDTDINPEGGAAQFSFKLTPMLDLFMNTASFILDENSAASDPWMFVLQPGFNLKLNDKTNLKFATAYYNFQQVQGMIPDYTGGGNNKRNSGFEFGFDSVSPSLELSINEPLKSIGITSLPFNLDIPYISFFGEYLNNLEAPYSNTGYLGGLRVGHQKVADKGQWQLRYMYVMLGSQAWPDFLPDSDRYTDGRTGIRSHEVILSYGLAKNLSLDFDYYHSWRTARSATAADPDALRQTENLFQADLNWKF